MLGQTTASGDNGKVRRSNTTLFKGLLFWQPTFSGQPGASATDRFRSASGLATDRFSSSLSMFEGSGGSVLDGESGVLTKVRVERNDVQTPAAGIYSL